MTTLLDIADMITRGVQATEAAIDRLLDDIKSRAVNYSFRSSSLRSKILASVNKNLPQLQNLTELPVALTHPDLSPFNYLVDDSTGRVRAVLDWDGASYLVLGSNFHFVDSFFGYMTQQGWRDDEHRQELEEAFYTRVLRNLALQGFGRVTKEQLELTKALGLIDHYLKRATTMNDNKIEQYLDDHLQRSTSNKHM